MSSSSSTNNLIQKGFSEDGYQVMGMDSTHLRACLNAFCLEKNMNARMYRDI